MASRSTMYRDRRKILLKQKCKQTIGLEFYIQHGLWPSQHPRGFPRLVPNSYPAGILPKCNELPSVAERNQYENSRRRLPENSLPVFQSSSCSTSASLNATVNSSNPHTNVGIILPSNEDTVQVISAGTYEDPPAIHQDIQNVPATLLENADEPMEIPVPELPTISTQDEVNNSSIPRVDVPLDGALEFTRNVIAPEVPDITSTAVSLFIRNLDIKEGLLSLERVFRQHPNAPINMMEKILRWNRDQILKLAMRISDRSIPEEFILPLEHRTIENEWGLHKYFQADMYCLCQVCSCWRPRSIFNKPFTLPCCSVYPSDTESHFVIFQLHELMQIILPSFKDKIREDFSNCSRLNDLRKRVGASSEDVFVSIGYDGVPFSSSSGISLYPVLGQIDGLSGQHTKASIFLIGLFIGSSTTSKPNVRDFLMPIVSQFKRLANNPMYWIDCKGNTRMSRVFLSSVLTDTVARTQVMYLTQFNGQFGCAWCLQERPNESKWDFLPVRQHKPPRTDKDLRNQLDQLYDDCGTQMSAGEGKNQGLKGRTPLAELFYFDLIRDFPPCTMHANYEGNAKMLLKYWMDNEFSKNTIMEIDAFLTSCKPPKRITRPPRKLSKLKKGHEFCVWLFYTAPVVLQDHLKQTLYNHFLFLVRALSFLHKECPTEAEICRADDNIGKFLKQYKNLYGAANGHYNIHILQHLCEFVRERGSMYKYSLMPMETYNKHLKELPTGPRCVTSQICKRFLTETIIRCRDEVKKNEDTELDCTAGIGEQSVRDIPNTTIREFLKSPQNPFHQEIYFSRLQINSKKLHSLAYRGCTTTNSACYHLDGARFFECHVFLETPAGFKAVGKCFQGERFNDLFYLFACQEETNFSIIPASDLQEVVFKMSYKNRVYVSKFLNNFESFSE